MQVDTTTQPLSSCYTTLLLRSVTFRHSSAFPCSSIPTRTRSCTPPSTALLLDTTHHTPAWIYSTPTVCRVMATGNSNTAGMPASAVPISPSSNTAPHGASAISTSSRGGTASQQQQQHRASNSNSTVNPSLEGGTPTRLSRGNSFRIPLPPNSPATGQGHAHGAISPSSPGGGGGLTTQLGTSYGSNNSASTGSRLGNFALGFRRNRGQSTNRGEITSPPVAIPAGYNSNNNPPSPPAFPSLQASTSLTDFGIASPYFDGSTGDSQQQQHGGVQGATANQATSPSGHAPSSSITGRGYFTRRGFGRKNTGGLLSGGRTPTSEQPPTSTPGGPTTTSSVLNRSRSSSQPSLPLSVSAGSNAAQAGTNVPPSSANAATMVFSGTSQPVLASASQTGNNNASTTGGSSSNDSSRRPSGEATRSAVAAATSTTSAAATSSTMHQRTASQAANATSSANNSNSAPSTSTSSSSETHHIRLVPHLESTRSLHFDPVSRDIQPTIPLRIGRFTDRNPNQPISSIDQNRIAFKSKVVSRTHAEIWFDPNPTPANNTSGAAGSGGWFIRDLKSSSGTFLNHIRLSGAGMESRPFPIRDGDVLQLGVDYQGGTEEIYRCVKMRIELNRGWQRGANSFK